MIVWGTADDLGNALSGEIHLCKMDLTPECTSNQALYNDGVLHLAPRSSLGVQ